MIEKTYTIAVFSFCAISALLDAHHVSKVLHEQVRHTFCFGLTEDQLREHGIAVFEEKFPLRNGWVFRSLSVMPISSGEQDEEGLRKKTFTLHTLN